MANSTIPTKTLTRIELAIALGVNPRTIDKWLREGMPIVSRGRGGLASRFDIGAVQAWKTARDVARKDANHDLMTARANKEHWQGQVAEQLFKTRARELLPREEVEKAWSAERDAIRTRVLALKMEAARVGRAMTLDGVPGVEVTLEAISREILIELSGAPAPQLEANKAASVRHKAKKKVAKRKVAKRPTRGALA